MNPYSSIIKERGTTFSKEKKEHPKPALDSSNDQIRLKHHGNPFLKEGFLVAVIGDEYNSTITVHRPIGVTKLDRKDWVMTPSNEVHHLLARAEDKSAEERCRAARTKYVSDGLVTSGIITVNDMQEAFYQSRTDMTRQELLKPYRLEKSTMDKAAQKRYAEAIHALSVSKETEHKARFPTRPYKPPRNLSEQVHKEIVPSVLDLITDKTIRKLEEGYQKAKKELELKAESTIKVEFVETVGGVRFNIPQSPVPALAKTSQKQAIDLIIRTMMDLSNLPAGISKVSVGSRASPGREPTGARGVSSPGIIPVATHQPTDEWFGPNPRGTNPKR